MNNVEISRAAMRLGGRATAIDVWLESDPDASELRIQNARENRDAMYAGEAAIHALLQRIDHLSAYIHGNQREVEYTRGLIQEIINHHNPQ